MNLSKKPVKPIILASFLTAALGVSTALYADDGIAQAPGKAFDLSHWKITLPIDKNGDSKPDEIEVGAIDKYVHSDFFYLNENGGMVFTAPNKAITTANSSNTRSELRYMLRGKNTRLKTNGPENNFAVEARKGSNRFGSVGGKMQATLAVNHVAKNSANPKAKAAYSAVVGQIHATKNDQNASGFGWGNEPIKIFYKKWPDHKMGSVFWTYERNLAKDDPNRTDIAYPVFGYDWKNDQDPGDKGIALNEEFSYTINVHRNTMYLTFSNERLGTVFFEKSLISNVDANGTVDTFDNPLSYGGDMLYFKAGNYNQCSTKKGSGGLWSAGCAGTGDWATDKANGDYSQATFSKLVVGDSTPPEIKTTSASK